MYSGSAYETDQSLLAVSEAPGFVVQFPREGRGSKNFTDEPGRRNIAPAVKMNSTQVFSLDEKFYLFNNKSKAEA